MLASKKQATKKRKENTISIHVIGMALLLTMFLQEHITSIVIKTLL
jgi:hypothetical protein